SAESLPLDDKDLEKRLRYLTELVYPAISSKGKAKQEQMSSRFNKSHELVEFSVGAMVLARDERRDGTTAPKFEGPFKVGSQTTDGSYILLDGTGEPLTRRYAPSQLKLFVRRKPLSAGDDDADSSGTLETTSESYEIEAILDHDTDPDYPHLFYYFVSWKDYGPEHNSWIPFDNFDDIQIVRKYWRGQKSRRFPPYVLEQSSADTSAAAAPKPKAKPPNKKQAAPAPDPSTLRRSKRRREGSK
ncbi:hypothetical protein DFQ27_009888, partial [Actinomortierella ambigua]